MQISRGLQRQRLHRGSPRRQRNEPHGGTAGSTADTEHGGTSTYPQSSGGGGYQKAPLSSSSPQNVVWVLLSTYQQLQHQLLRGLDGRGNRLPRVEPGLGNAAHARQASKNQAHNVQPVISSPPCQGCGRTRPKLHGLRWARAERHPQNQSWKHHQVYSTLLRIASPLLRSHRPKPAAPAGHRQAAPGGPLGQPAAPSAAAGRPDPRGHATSSLFS